MCKVMQQYESVARAESVAEGMAKGMAKGIQQAMISLVKKGLLSIENAAQESGLSVPEFEKLL